MDAHILIVDDEPKNVALLSELFYLQGARVSSAHDGQSALDAVVSHRPDLILLDVAMPGMDGFEVCRRVKADEATGRIPVVMITGLRGLEDKIKGLEAGADDFLNKPVNPAELVTRSRNLLRIKDLGDELEGAYRSLAEIASYTNTLLQEFNPYDFDPFQGLAGLMKFLLRPGGGDHTRPQQALLLNTNDGNTWEGWLYFRQQGTVSFSSLKGSVNSAELEPIFAGQQVAFMNLGGDKKGQDNQPSLWEKLGAPAPSRNLVGYRSGSVAVLAMDFGKQVGPYEAQVLSALVATIHFFLKTIASQIQEVENAFLYTIGALARAAELHDEDTGNHLLRVNLYAEALANSLGCPEDFIRTMAYSAQMHDVGKMHVHPDILRKPGALDDAEWEEVKLHTIYGARILGEDPRLHMARQVALSHHEHWDGSGYPYGLGGEEIPLAGRIVMMADVYDALRSARPYKEPFGHARSVEIIQHGDSRLQPGWFDPQVLKAFLDIQEQFEGIYEQHNE